MPKTTAANFKEIKRILRELEHQQTELDLEILGQETGGARNLMTEANIFLMQSIEKLKELIS